MFLLFLFRFLRKVNDPQASVESKRKARLDIERKYGLNAARLADNTIQAAQQAERQKNLQIWTARRARQQVKCAQDAVEDQQRLLDLAKAEVERLVQVAENEEAFIRLQTEAYERKRRRADQRFDEFYSAAKKGKIIDMVSPLSTYTSSRC